MHPYRSVCPHCGTPVENREVAVKRLLAGKKTILCVDCEKRVPLWDELEERFASAELQQRVRELQAQSQLVLDNESKERALVGEVISTVALAGQLSREFSVSDKGLDIEIEQQKVVSGLRAGLFNQWDLPTFPLPLPFPLTPSYFQKARTRRGLTTATAMSC